MVARTNNYSPGAWQGFVPNVGEYFSPMQNIGTSVAQGNVAISANTIWLGACWIPIELTISNVRIWLQTGIAASFVEIGLFTIPINGQSTLIADLGQIPTTANATYLDLAPTAMPLIGPGFFCIGLNPSAGITIAVQNCGTGLSNNSSSIPVSAWSGGAVAGAFNASYSGLTTTTSMPWFSLRRGS